MDWKIMSINWGRKKYSRLAQASRLHPWFLY